MPSALGDVLPNGGTVVGELFTDALGNEVGPDSPDAVAVELTIRYPDGEESRTYASLR